MPELNREAIGVATDAPADDTHYLPVDVWTQVRADADDAPPSATENPKDIT